jgi:hypothetical protein
MDLSRLSRQFGLIGNRHVQFLILPIQKSHGQFFFLLPEKTHGTNLRLEVRCQRTDYRPSYLPTLSREPCVFYPRSATLLPLLSALCPVRFALCALRLANIQYQLFKHQLGVLAAGFQVFFRRTEGLKGIEKLGFGKARRFF